MPDTDPPRAPHQDDLLISHLRRFLGSTDAAAIDAVRGRLRWMTLAGGETLMRQGEPGDALYLLVSGRLRVYVEQDGERRAVREIPRGEVVGEMSLFTDAPRSATLVAIRDSVLVSLGKEDFARLQASSPQVTLTLTRQVIERLRTERRGGGDRPVTMALLPISAGVDAPALAAALAGELGRFGRVALLDDAEVERRLGGAGPDDARTDHGVAQLLDEVEGTHDFVLLVGDVAPTPWARRCTRHADEILLLADAAAPPMLHPLEQAFLADRPGRTEAAEILVLLHAADTPMPQHSARWLARRPVADHVHLRPARAADVARLARLQARRAVGLVLAGGGARGFAHLGTYRALREQGLEVDVVAGTSIGAVMAALIASDQTPERLEQIARDAFAANPTGDWTLLPLLSLIKGRRLRRVLDEAVAAHVGAGAGLEDLWKGFFCIASNLSRACEVVLERGDLVESLLASTSIPGALPPVLKDGELLCDGGSFNNFPVDVMRRRRGVGRVIGVDLSRAAPRRIELDAMPSGWALLWDRLKPRRARRYRVPGMPVILMNATVLYSLSRREQGRAQTDLYFNPPLERVGMLDWRRFDQVVRHGYEHAREVLAQASAASEPDAA